MVSLKKPRSGRSARAGGGRPRLDGDRYPSGRLKPIKPNEDVLARRLAICADPKMATCPLDASLANGWITQSEYGAGRVFLSVHVGAGLQSPGAASMRDNSIPTGTADLVRPNWAEMTDVQVRAMQWKEFSNKEIAAIWDSALRDMGRADTPTGESDFAARAHQRWRALNAAMTPIERTVVDSFCIREEWPQWIAERLAGRAQTVHEEKREILVSGLQAISRVMRKPASAARQDLALPMPVKRSGPVLIERVEIVNDNDEVIQVHERIKRR